MDPDLASDRYMEFDAVEDDAFLIQRIDSNEIIYCPPKRKYKVFIGSVFVFRQGVRGVALHPWGPWAGQGRVGGRVWRDNMGRMPRWYFILRVIFCVLGRDGWWGRPGCLRVDAVASGWSTQWWHSPRGPARI